MDTFNFQIPGTDGLTNSISLSVGHVLYVLGANGTGKSSLVSRLFNQNQSSAKRISAHRQTWFESNTLDLTPRSREDLERNARSQDAQPHSRYREWNPAGRATMAIFDLIDADTMQCRTITERLRADDVLGAKLLAQTPSPLKVINELMRLSNIPIEISVEKGQKVVASKNGGSAYSVAELSDGERNAFLIAAEVLTAQAGTLILIDEPERHLHRAIVSPLLRLLFERRRDCAFIVSTHELMLPIDTPDASTLLVRGCRYQGQDVREWTLDLVPPGMATDNAIKNDVLGSRRKILFVEGTSKSLDAPLYSLLFPQVSVVPKQGCREVEHAVRGLRGADDLHWVSAWGIIDRDQRSADEVARLREAGVWALPHYSVESLYYHRSVLDRIADRQAAVTGDSASDLVDAALSGAVAATKNSRKHLTSSAVLRAARNQVMGCLPTRAKDLQEDLSITVNVDLASLRLAEEQLFDRLIDGADWNGLLARYPLRESRAFSSLVDGLKVKNVTTYETAVLKLLQDDATALEHLRSLFSGLHSEIAHEGGREMGTDYANTLSIRT